MRLHLKILGMVLIVCSLWAGDSLFVRRVEFTKNPIFPLEEGYTFFPFPLLNKLHINTKDFVLKKHLTFAHFIHPEKLEFRLDETCRIIRAKEFVGDASVESVYIENDTIDIVFSVDEVWTTKPSASLSFIGDRIEYGVDFTESNFLGLGTELEAEYEKAVDDDFIHLTLTTAPILPYNTKLSLYHDRTDRSEESRFRLSRPYLSGEKKILGKIDFLTSSGKRDRYFNSDSILYEYRLNQTYFGSGVYYRLHNELYGGLGFSHLEREISHSNMEDGVLMRDEIMRNSFHAGLTFLSVEYSRQSPIDEFSYDPDIAQGFSGSLCLHIDTELRTQVSVAGQFNGNFPFGYTSIGLSSNYYDYVRKNDVFVNYASPRFLMSRLVFSGQYHSYESSTDTELFEIGSRNRLRGYSYREIVSKEMMTANLEYRLFPPWEILSIRSSFVLFTDAGSSGGEWLQSVGCGLRLTSTKSTSGTIGRLELAFPLPEKTPTIILKTGLPFDVLKAIEHDFHPFRRDKIY